MALEDEREQIKALKRKHISNTKDLQRQIAHCKRYLYISNEALCSCLYGMHICGLTVSNLSMNRRMEQLESQVPTDRESPATLPITEGSRTSSHSSIEALPPSTLLTHHRASSPLDDGEVSHIQLLLYILILSSLTESTATVSSRVTHWDSSSDVSRCAGPREESTCREDMHSQTRNGSLRREDRIF